MEDQEVEEGEEHGEGEEDGEEQEETTNKGRGKLICLLERR